MAVGLKCLYGRSNCRIAAAKYRVETAVGLHHSENNHHVAPSVLFFDATQEAPIDRQCPRFRRIRGNRSYKRREALLFLLV